MKLLKSFVVNKNIKFKSISAFLKKNLNDFIASSNGKFTQKNFLIQRGSIRECCGARTLIFILFFINSLYDFKHLKSSQRTFIHDFNKKLGHILQYYGCELGMIEPNSDSNGMFLNIQFQIQINFLMLKLQESLRLLLE